MKKCFWNVSKGNIRSVGKQAETSPVQMLGFMVIINTTTDGSLTSLASLAEEKELSENSF